MRRNDSKLFFHGLKVFAYEGNCPDTWKTTTERMKATLFSVHDERYPSLSNKLHTKLTLSSASFHMQHLSPDEIPK